MRISVEPEVLRQQAAVYTRASEMIDEAKGLVDQTNGEMSEQWQGKAFEAYLEQYRELETHIYRFKELLQDINKQLVDYAGIQEERDSQDASYFGIN